VGVVSGVGLVAAHSGCYGPIRDSAPVITTDCQGGPTLITQHCVPAAGQDAEIGRNSRPSGHGLTRRRSGSLRR
jgi:hypothetical protein